jgi:hypothetical protein
MVLKLALAWIFSLAVLIGPYAALLHAFPALPVWAHVCYWLAMLMYVAFAADHQPDYDESNLGIGGTMIDNPFSFEDDLNRLGLAIAVAMLPGKVIWWSMAMTWRMARS